MILIEDVKFLPVLDKKPIGAVILELPEPLIVEERIYTGQIATAKVDFWINEADGIEQMMIKQVRKWEAIFPYGESGQNKARVGPNDISYIKTRF